MTAKLRVPADPIGLTEVADLASLDAERVRQWLFARCVQERLGEGPPWPALDVILQRLDPSADAHPRSAGGRRRSVILFGEPRTHGE